MKKKKAVSALSGPSGIVSVDSEPFLCLFIGTLMFVFLYPDIWLSFSCQILATRLYLSIPPWPLRACRRRSRRCLPVRCRRRCHDPPRRTGLVFTLASWAYCELRNSQRHPSHPGIFRTTVLQHSSRSWANASNARPVQKRRLEVAKPNKFLNLAFKSFSQLITWRNC